MFILHYHLVIYGNVVIFVLSIAKGAEIASKEIVKPHGGMACTA